MHMHIREFLHINMCALMCMYMIYNYIDSGKVVDKSVKSRNTNWSVSGSNGCLESRRNKEEVQKALLPSVMFNTVTSLVAESIHL